VSIIQKAAQRLEELNRAGIDVPARPGPGPSAAAVAAERPAAPLFRAAPGVPAAPAQAPNEPSRRSAEVVLDLARMEAHGFLVSSDARTELAEEFRHIKQPLLRSVREAGRKPGTREGLIMVTSALPREGKTFCAINLALSMAMEVDTSVLLVDADVVRPSVLDRLGLPAARGLLDLLTEPSLEPADVLLRTNVPKLTLLPAGTRNARSTELLGSEAMEQLLVDLSNRYADRIIVFDAPPLLLTSEAKVLAARVGQVVMVVEAGNTSRSAVTEAFTAVEQCPKVMTVLNRCAEPLNDRRYGYYY
jgi:receptor protein-tyrosine kinase